MPSLISMAITYFKIGLFSFGAATSEVMIEQLTEKRRWLALADYAGLMSVVTPIPGPFHVNLVIASGFKIHGFAGSFVGVVSFVAPGFILAIAAAVLLFGTAAQAWLGANPGVSRGLIAAVAGLLLSAVYKLSRRILSGWGYLLVLIILATALIWRHVPFGILLGISGALYLLATIIVDYSRRPNS
jgi:chromate transporter